MKDVPRWTAGTDRSVAAGRDPERGATESSASAPTRDDRDGDSQAGHGPDRPVRGYEPSTAERDGGGSSAVSTEAVASSKGPSGTPSSNGSAGTAASTEARDTSDGASGATGDESSEDDRPPSIVERVDEVLQRDDGDRASSDRASSSDGSGAARDRPVEADADASVDRSSGADDRDGEVTAVRECQNCAATAADGGPRDVGFDGLTVDLCDDCRTAATGHDRSLEECRRAGVPVSVAGAEACEACGEVASLEAHAVVPIDAGGFRHSNNVLALCPDCHAAVDCHDEAAE